MYGAKTNGKNSHELIFYVQYDFEYHDTLYTDELKNYGIGHPEIKKKNGMWNRTM